MTKRTDTIAHSGEAAPRTVGRQIDVPIDALVPNRWNPNVQSEWMFQKELASIREFGFVDPIIVRQGDLSFDADNIYAKLTETGVEAWTYEIIDGEHRWKAAKQLGYEKVPCWDLGPVDDETAKQLTIVLNETRGQPDENRLKNLLDDLLKSRPQERLLDVLPFSKERFEELTQHREIDWNALQQQRDKMNEDSGDRWKELVYRMPADAAAVVERAIKTLVESEGFNHDWQALEMMAADSLS